MAANPATSPSADTATAAVAACSSSKYSALPDIDTAPDVYETPDPAFNLRSVPNLDEDETFAQKGDTTDETINNENIVPARARERFAKDEEKDEQDRQLASRHRRALLRKQVNRGLESSEYELNPRAPDFEETTEQKFRRLQFEVNDLSRELEAKGQEAAAAKCTPPPDQLQAQVQLLREQLGDMTSKRIVADKLEHSTALLSRAVAGNELLKEINAYRRRKRAAEKAKPSEDATSKGAAPTDSVTYELYYSPEVANLHQVARSGALEARMAAIEKAVLGTAGEMSADNLPAVVANDSNLAAAVARLDQNLQLLARPNQLEQASRKIKTFIADLEKLQELRVKEVPLGPGGGTVAGTMTKETEAKVNSLFDLLGKIDPLIPLAPAVLARLRALRSLHQEAAVVSETVKLITADQARISDEVSSLQQACEKLEQSMAENQEVTGQNLESLTTRMTTLLGRVDKLKA